MLLDRLTVEPMKRKVQTGKITKKINAVWLKKWLICTLLLKVVFSSKALEISHINFLKSPVFEE